MSAPPLSHITVLDLSRVLAGPWASQNLADMGARVLKVERPESGDDTRHWGPPYLAKTKESAYYLAANRSKQSITVDITTAEGQERIKELAATSDVVIENFRVGGLQRYGLDYASLHRINPRLIYCSITGFGQTGPLADKPGYDYIIQAMGGVMSITGVPDAQGGEPMRVGVPFADVMTGMVATQAVLGALLARDTPSHPQYGKGQYIDLALFDVQLSMLANQAMNALTSGQSPVRQGNSHPTIVPYQLFHASDAPFILAVGNDGQFMRLCKALDKNEWAADDRFASNPARVRHRQTLVPLLEEIFALNTAQHWLELCEKADIPCGPVLDVLQALHHPQAQARGMLVEVPHPTGGKVTLLRSPVRYSDTPLDTPTAPPLLGEHDVSDI